MQRERWLNNYDRILGVCDMAYDESEGEGVWIYCEQEKGEIHPVSYELLNKGRELADDLNTHLTALFLTPNGSDAQELIYRGADRVYLLEHDSFNYPNEIPFRKNIVELVKGNKPEILLIGATHFGRSLGPRVAGALETGLTADCTGLKIEDGDFVQIRPAFTGNILAHISTDRCPKMSTVRYKEFDEFERDNDREGEIIEIDTLQYSGPDVKILDEIKVDDVDIQDSEIVVSAGKGLKDSQDFELIEELCSNLGGTVGSSRPLVDEGWISRNHQVGYSGNRVKPNLYIACGISGAPQHLAGMKESKIIVAINTDPSAPIFDYADYGIIGDLYEVVPKLIKELKEG